MNNFTHLQEFKEGTRVATLTVEQTRYVINLLEDRIASLRKYNTPEVAADELETAAGVALEMYFALENSAEH